MRGLLGLEVQEATAAVQASSVSTLFQRSLGLMAALVTSGVVHCAVAQAGAEGVAEAEERASAAPAEIPPATAATAAEVACAALDGAFEEWEPAAAAAEIPFSTAAIAAEVAGFMVVLERAGDALVIEEIARAMAINAAW